MSHVRKRLCGQPSRDKAPRLSDYLKPLEQGLRVTVKLLPSSKKRPDPRLQGFSGVIRSVGRRAAVVELSFGTCRKHKIFAIYPQHLRILR